MTRKEEIELCVDKLKDDINFNCHLLTRAKIVSKKESDNLKYWISIMDRNLKDIVKYINEHNSI